MRTRMRRQVEKSPGHASVYRWLDEHKDDVLKRLSDDNGDLEQENDRLRDALEWYASGHPHFYPSNRARAALLNMSPEDPAAVERAWVKRNKWVERNKKVED